MNFQTKQFCGPNMMGRIVLLGVEDVLGRNGLEKVLNLADLSEVVGSLPEASFDRQFGFDRLSRIMLCIERYFGPRAGRGIALRLGRACFKRALRAYGPRLGVNDMSFRLLPLSTKLNKSSEVFANMVNKHTDQEIYLEEGDDKIWWHIEHCPICWQRKTESPACHLAVGFLQEALYWVSGGKSFRVEETACIAQGNPVCTIEINKVPLG